MSRPNNKHSVEQKVSRDFRNRVFAAVEPELKELQKSTEGNRWWQLKYASYIALACIAWLAGMQVFESENDEALLAELEILDFVHEGNIDDLNLMMDLEPDDFEFLLENEIDGEDA